MEIEDIFKEGNSTQESIHLDKGHIMNEEEMRFYSEIADNYKENPITELPIDGLKDWQQEMINNLKDVFSCNTDYIVASFLTVAGVAIGSKIKSFDGIYHNTASLWTVLVGRSGVNKSQVIKWLIKPIEDADGHNYNESKKKFKGKSDKRPFDFEQRIFSDHTPESRNVLLAHNPIGIILVRDEIRGFIDDIFRYNKSGEISQLLSIFDNTSFFVNRKKEGKLLIKNPFMSILGGIQPNILKITFGVIHFKDSGFNARVLWVYPNIDSNPSTYSNVQNSEYNAREWKAFINNLMNFKNNVVAKFSPSAMSEYKNYWNYLQFMKSKNESMAPTYSKLQIYAQKIALITEILISSNLDNIEISDKSMNYAISVCRYFEQTASKVNSLFTSNITYSNITKEEVVRKLIDFYPHVNQSRLAFLLGISRQAISKKLSNV